MHKSATLRPSSTFSKVGGTGALIMEQGNGAFRFDTYAPLVPYDSSSSPFCSQYLLVVSSLPPTLAQPILEKVSREEQLADIFKCLGNIYLATKDLKIARQNFSRAFQLFSKIGHDSGKNECASFITSIDNQEQQRKLEMKSKKLEDRLRLLEAAPLSPPSDDDDSEDGQAAPPMFG